jgi:hypothetical protein
MSERDARWGFCEAYGCPMFGVYGVAGKWFCCCHFQADHAVNDAITAELNRHLWIVESTLEIRRFYNSEEWLTVAAGIEKRLRDRERKDLCAGFPDEWLGRLESVLTAMCREIGRQQHLPIGGVIGPTDAPPAYTEAA